MDGLILLCSIVLITVVLLALLMPQSPERTGSYGEATVEAIVNAEAQKGLYGEVFRNVYVPRADGSTSEIDVILVCVKGIFVFESKNFAGYIFGSEQNRNWTVTLYAGKNLIGLKEIEKHRFYNPIWQNRTHIKALRNLTNTSAPIYSVIVFSNRGELKAVDYDMDKTTIVKSNQLKRFMRDVRINYPEVLSIEGVDRLSEIIAQHVGVDESVKQAHVESIRMKAEAPEVCPWCGGRLIVRTAKKGPNAGNQFYGCSNFPQCRYTRNKDQ